MSGTSPPVEAQRFGRSQTPESPRPVHLPEPSNIPVLMNQMDPVFNDTATYNIPNNQTFSPYSDSNRALPESNVEEHDAVQNFLRGAEEESARLEEEAQFPVVQDQYIPNSSLSGQPSQSEVAKMSDSDIAPASEALNISSAQAHSANATNQLNADAERMLGIDQTSNAINSTNSQNNNFTNPTDTHSINFDNANEPNPQKAEEGVDYQSLLDTISQSASTAPPAENITVPTTAASDIEQDVPSLPSIPGLPPKPPPQENTLEFPSYPVNNAANAYSTFLDTGVPDQYSMPTEKGIQSDLTNFVPPNATNLAHNGLNYAMNQTLDINPAPGTQQSSMNIEQNKFQETRQPSSALSSQGEPTERPWTPRTQSLYDQFLEDERRYVTEGIWDRFPNGSRLFVGNLPSEKVTKRDLFHTFHRHGRLAQISIKQAYGFVQYLDTASCYNALTAEQGVEIRGRKIHLEVSKPQKNTRNAGGGGGNNKSNARRRSRSPDRNSSRTNNDRHGGRPPFSDFRDEPGRRRDEHRSVRSPSPRSYRSRDEHWSHESSLRGYTGQENRQRSPVYANNYTPQSFDDDAVLPLPRRDPRHIPDVQILILDNQVAQSFINWVEQGFQSKSLRASTIWLSPKLPLAAVIKRQIIEGVQAVVKLTQNNQYNSKIPLQVFDRTAGASNVNFNEYVELDVPVAADIVIHARQKERGSGSAAAASAQYAPVHGYNNPQAQYGQIPVQQQPQQYPPPTPLQYNQQAPNQYSYQAQQTQYRPPTQGSGPPNPNAPNLQQLLANLRQPSDGQPPPQNTISNQSGRPTDLSGLLSNIAARQSQPQQYHQGQQQSSNQGYGGMPAQGYGSGQQPHQNVQNIMEQLARYNR